MDIVIYTEGLPFDGATPFERSLGGSESAVVFMARELARLGHAVQVFCACERPGEYDGVRYRDLSDFAEFIEEGACDVFVCCRHLRGLASPVQSKVNVLWAHDIITDQVAASVTSLMFKTDRLFVLSEFHRSQVMRHLDVPDGRYFVTRNGVDLGVVDEAIAGVQRDPNRLLYTSRPERGLEALLGMWPLLKQRRPELTLAIAHYENPAADREMAEYQEALRRAAEQMPEVEHLGPLSKRELYREIAGSALVVYPSTFPEVSCISALEAAACGTPVVASRYCALKETVADGETGALVPGDPRTEEYAIAFTEAVVGLLSDEERYRVMGAAARARVESRYQWRQIAMEWEAALSELLSEPSAGRRQTVSVCMIVKDAQGTLYRCLDSVKPIADEIIICDTGSTDRTMEIAGEYTDRVYQIPWTNDFSAARNQSVAKATKDWILWIDADEYLIGAEKLGTYLRENMFNGYVIQQHHHAIDAQFRPDSPVRLYRNKRGVRFFGCIHEHPETELNKGIRPAITLSDVHIVHDGYVTEEIRRGRFKRNLPMLIEDRRRHPNRRLGLVFLERDLVHMARYEAEHMHGQVTARAEQWLRQAIGIHRTHFASPEDPLHGYSFPLYQSALEMLGEGLEIGYFLAVRDGLTPGSRSMPPVELQRRRVLDETEAREFLELQFTQLLKAARPEEEFGFEGEGDQMSR